MTLLLFTIVSLASCNSGDGGSSGKTPVTTEAARARWPFIHTWDDHEFSNDCWQSEANYIDAGSNSSTDEPSQMRKLAANQAWFEYLPVNLRQGDDIDVDLHHAKEFAFTTVQDSPNTTVDDSNFSNNADNIATINSMSIYRSFRFGALMDLIVSDNRSYRSDHAIPENISGNSSLFVEPRMVMPRDLINQLDAGKTDNNGDPSLFIFTGSLQLNPRFNRPPGTMLGENQKQWWKDSLTRSNALWKLWGNSVPLMRNIVNLSRLNNGLPDVVLSSDTWDGYASERNELMNFLLANNIENVVSLSGDVHAHFAGSVMNNYDAQAPETSTAAMTEFVCASISSVSMFAAVRKLSRRENPTETEQTLQKLITYDATKASTQGPNTIVNNLNNSLRNEVLAGLAAAETNSEAEIDAAKDETVNPHIKYVDTDAHGFGLVCITEEELRVKIPALPDGAFLKQL